MNYEKIIGYIIGKMLVNGTYYGVGRLELWEHDEHFKDINNYLEQFTIPGPKLSNGSLGTPALMNRKRIRSNGTFKVEWSIPTRSDSVKSILGYGELTEPDIAYGIVVAVLNKTKNSNCMHFETYEANHIQQAFDSLGITLREHMRAPLGNGKGTTTIRLYRDKNDWDRALSNPLFSGNILTNPFLNKEVNETISRYIDNTFAKHIINSISESIMVNKDMGVVNKQLKIDDPLEVMEDRKAFHDKPALPIDRKQIDYGTNNGRPDSNYKNVFKEVIIDNNYWRNSDNRYMCKVCHKGFDKPMEHECIDEYLEKKETIKLETEYMKETIPIMKTDDIEANKELVKNTWIGDALSEFRSEAKEDKMQGVKQKDIDPLKEFYTKWGTYWETEGITKDGVIIDRPRYQRVQHKFLEEKKEECLKNGMTVEQYNSMAEKWYDINEI